MALSSLFKYVVDVICYTALLLVSNKISCRLQQDLNSDVWTRSWLIEDPKNLFAFMMPISAILMVRNLYCIGHSRFRKKIILGSFFLFSKMTENKLILWRITSKLLYLSVWWEIIPSSLYRWTEQITGDEGSHLPNCQNFFVIITLLCFGIS